VCYRAVENREAEVEPGEAVSCCHLEELACTDTSAAGLGIYPVRRVGVGVVGVSSAVDGDNEIEVGSDIPYPEFAAAGLNMLDTGTVVQETRIEKG
jgi:hypothetical protein